jgi:hypothetical protein
MNVRRSTRRTGCSHERFPCRFARSRGTPAEMAVIPVAATKFCYRQTFLGHLIIRHGRRGT